ncbi:MAG: DNA polymerase III subunit delta [Chloroflexi bacterium]|nr:DNA polymerase III subunit delta [Chloroflexota bacterium]
MPNLIILRGDDPTRVTELLAGYRESLGDPGTADLNYTVVEGENLNLESLRADISTMPFLADKRLVVVNNAQVFLSKTKKEDRQRTLDLFNELPDTSLLVLVIDDVSKRKRGMISWENDKAYNWLTDWVNKKTNNIEWIDCALPSEGEMSQWIIAQAKQQGGGFQPDAARLLGSYVGNNTLRARQEIDKLLTYVGPSRVVTPEDVVLLTAQEQEGDIFAFTDALGERDSAKAMDQFQRLTDRADVVELAPMIHRQFRLLIQAREIMDEDGRAAQIEKELGVLSFIAQKLEKQARLFKLPQLLAIYQRLLKIDEDMKTGGMPGDVAFELFIADLTRK